MSPFAPRKAVLSRSKRRLFRQGVFAESLIPVSRHASRRKPLMAMKDFDWKKFMIQKGERVALGVAGFITLLLLIFNVKSIFSAGPAKNADVLKKKTQVLRDQLASNRPKDSDKPEKSDDVMRSFDFTYINDPSRYQLPPLFPASGSVDHKRLQPELYAPVDGKAAAVHAQLSSC